MKTIQKQLLMYLTGCMMLAMIVAGIATYVDVRSETNELFDYQLKQIASTLPDGIAAGHDVPEDRNQNEIVVQVWDAVGKRIFSAGPARKVPYTRKPGFSSISIDGDAWRIYTEIDNRHTVQVAQPKEVRRELAAGLVIRALIPFILLIPIFGFLAWTLTEKALSPLKRLTQEIAKRSPHFLVALKEQFYPHELRPTLQALNALLAKLAQTLDVQRTFVADAAHELRMPLVALKLQIESVEKERNPALKAAGFNQLHARLSCINYSIQQMLTLAFHEQLNPLCGLKKIDLRKLVASVVADHALQAASSNISLDFSTTANDETPRQVIAGDDASLRMLLGNLIDNALRHANAKVNVQVNFSAANRQAIVKISDDGPGSRAAENKLMFDRVYRRGEKEKFETGLGLFIARAIAAQHLATIDVIDGQLSGVTIAVSFPLMTD